MKSLNKTINRTFILFSLFAAALISAQNITGKSSKSVVSGTSPMHDWDMISTSSTFSGTVSGNAIANVKYVMVANTLKSKKGKMMDNKAYKALKTETSPNISFTATSLPLGKSSVTGKLTIAGVTKTVTIAVNVVKTGNSFNISGMSNMKMSDFGMETPGFLGVHTGDAIKVNVNVIAN